MGNEITKSNFTDSETNDFNTRLKLETQYLKTLFKSNAFDNKSYKFGYELEVCLLDQQAKPKPINQNIISDTGNPLFTAELATFNLEINGNPFKLSDSVFEKLHQDIQQLYKEAEASAQIYDSKVGLFGVLPNLLKEHLNAKDYMSDLNRYHLISDQLLKMRQRPIKLTLDGKDTLEVEKEDVMLEALGTSFQVHLQIPFKQSVDYYHASLWASLALIGISANSPIVLGKSCWHESRISIFEQAVDTRTLEESKQGDTPRVFLGTGYVESIFQLFEENLEYQTILPELGNHPIEELAHLNLHNGTVWRWIRPILDIGKNNDHNLRFELRVVPAGPTIIDTMSNMVFYIGLIEGLKNTPNDLTKIPFNTLKNQFYDVAKNGLNTKITWCNNKTEAIQNIIINDCIPLAQSGLKALGIKNSAQWLDIILERAKTAQTGADWMLDYWENNPDADQLVKTYLSNAAKNIPVHLWKKYTQ